MIAVSKHREDDTIRYGIHFSVDKFLFSDLRTLHGEEAVLSTKKRMKDELYQEIDTLIEKM